MAVKLEYVWLDGYKPTQSLRSKTKIEKEFNGKLANLDNWAFDGSSTEQAPGGSSDCILKPVYVVPDPQRKNAFLVMCEVLYADGTAHPSNGRATIEDDDNDFWFGFEQEYFLWDTATNKPLGFPAGGFPGPQGPYYCAVGANNAFGREIVKEHLEVYGADNHLRLTGKHETASILDFNYGVSDRGASIRIPVVTVQRGWKGYLEDRRPNSAADPYKVAARIIKTVKSAVV